MLKTSVDWLLYGLFGLDAQSHLVQSLNFFVYDSIKIILLLFFMIAAIGVIRTYIPENKIKKWILRQQVGVANIMASLFGALTPFCSCSSIPIFLSFVRAGIPLGTTFSFLITSPLVNEYLVVLMLGFFGWKITLAYVISGIIIGVISGFLLGRLKLEKYLVKDMIKPQCCCCANQKDMSFNQRIGFGLKEGTDVVKKIWLWVLVGIAIGALIHNYVPDEVIAGIVKSGGALTVPLAVLIGVPIYGSCAAIVPIALVLFNKGVPLGTALAFMMAISALSLPEAVILKRAMKMKLIVIFFVIVTISIIFTGYLFNILQPLIT